jgi:lysozyme
VKVSLTQGQFDLLVDFIFNLGDGRLASSTLLKDLNAGKYVEVAQQLLMRDHSWARKFEMRREVEFKLWSAGVASQAHVA